MLASQQSHGYPVELQQASPLTVPSHSFIFRAVSENDVFKALRTMDISKATGADTIPAKVIRTAAPYISNVVAKLFNTSFRCSRFPSTWKTARVTTFFNGGPQTERDNYRPISILPCISEVHESFVLSVISIFVRLWLYCMGECSKANVQRLERLQNQECE